MMALKATSSSTGSTRNQARLFQVLSMSGRPSFDHLAPDDPAVGIDLDAAPVEADANVAGGDRYVLLGNDVERVGAEPHHDDLDAAEIVNPLNGDRQAVCVSGDLDKLGSDAELDLG